MPAQSPHFDTEREAIEHLKRFGLERNRTYGKPSGEFPRTYWRWKDGRTNFFEVGKHPELSYSATITQLNPRHFVVAIFLPQKSEVAG